MADFPAVAAAASGHLTHRCDPVPVWLGDRQLPDLFDVGSASHIRERNLRLDGWAFLIGGEWDGAQAPGAELFFEGRGLGLVVK